MKMLRNLQGLHAPLRLVMERKAVQNVGHLPCLHRHNVMLDALTGENCSAYPHLFHVSINGFVFIFKGETWTWNLRIS